MSSVAQSRARAASTGPWVSGAARAGAVVFVRVTDAVDTLLDRTIVPGYSRFGYSLRHTWWPADLLPGTLDGRTVAVTGANSGLGKATALSAAGLGAAVRMLCRDTERGAAARADILRVVPGADIVVDECDLSDQTSVRACAAALRDELPGLHALVHNAGVMPPQRTETADGHELAVATHVLGPHLLTGQLRSLLAADGDARVVFVSSGGMYAQRLRIDDPEFHEGNYDAAAAYARTKRMQVVLARMWAARLADQRVAVHAMHPGWSDTPGLRESLPRFARMVGPIMRTAAQGADTAVWLLAADGAARSTGLFWHDRRPRPTDYLPYTRHNADDAARLWDYCEVATG